MKPHEEAARLRKVLALIEAIDTIARRVEARPAAVLHLLETADDLIWVAFAVEAGIHRPSQKTREEVLAVYRRRVARG